MVLTQVNILFFDELLAIVLRSLWISFAGVVIASVIALPLAVILAGRRFRGHAFIVALSHALMALPPVVVGLVLYVLFRPQGFFGGAGLLYTLTIMIIAQAILATPIIFALAHEALIAPHEKFRAVFHSYPSRPWLTHYMVLREARFGVATAIAAGLGRTLAEVGAVLIVGGNIKGLTQVMTTLIVQDTQQGRLDRALSAGLMLFVLAVGLSLLAFWWRRASERLRHG